MTIERYDEEFSVSTSALMQHIDRFLENHLVSLKGATPELMSRDRDWQFQCVGLLHDFVGYVAKKQIELNKFGKALSEDE